MTPDWHTIAPRCSSIGTSPITLTARYAGVRVSPLKKSTNRGSQSAPANCSASAGLYAFPDWAKQWSTYSAISTSLQFVRSLAESPRGPATKPARREPALHLIETVQAPERLAVDEDERRTEHAAPHRLLDFAL